LSRAEPSVEPDVLWASAPGSKREGDEDPSQDAIAVARDGDSLIAVVADGAGSQADSGMGARFAAHGALESLKVGLEGVESKSAVEAALRAAVRDARHCLVTIAAAASDEGGGLRLENLSTTLSVCLVTPKWVGLGSIGDGIHVLRDPDGELSLAAMAPDTDVANHTDFITGADALEKIEIEVREATTVESVLLSTDGLDAQLLGRLDGARWALATVNSLIDAPALDGWGAAEFERLLSSEVIRDQTTDDCSLVLIRRLAPIPGSQNLEGLELSSIGRLSSGRRTWAVGGCADLFAVELPPSVDPGAPISSRGAQVWDRTRRYPPVSWPVRRLGQQLVLVPRVLEGARSASSALNKFLPGRKKAVLVGIRQCVEAVHTAGVAHGELSEECFVLQDDDTVTLCEPGPGMFDGSGLDECIHRDLDFLAGIEGGGAAPEEEEEEEAANGDRSAGRAEHRRRIPFGRRG
jgi:hypothetical protein